MNAQLVKVIIWHNACFHSLQHKGLFHLCVLLTRVYINKSVHLTVFSPYFSLCLSVLISSCLLSLSISLTLFWHSLCLSFTPFSLIHLFLFLLVSLGKIVIKNIYHNIVYTTSRLFTYVPMCKTSGQKINTFPIKFIVCLLKAGTLKYRQLTMFNILNWNTLYYAVVNICLVQRNNAV